MKPIRKWRPLLLVVAFTTSIANTTGQDRYDVPISKERLIRDLGMFKECLKTIQPGLYRYYPETVFDSLYVVIERRIDGPKSPVWLYRQLLPLHRFIANNHTRIEPPPSYVDALMKGLPRFPFECTMIDGRLYVLKDYSQERSIPIGSELLAINGERTSSVIGRIRSGFRTDGHNTSFPDFAIGTSFSRQFAYVFGTPERFELTFSTQDGSTRQTMVRALPLQRLSKDIKAKPEMLPALSFRVLRDSVGLLTVRTFQPKSGSRFKKRLGVIFDSIRSGEFPRLLLDVRGNGGGYPELADALLRYFITDPLRLYDDEYALVQKLPHDAHFEKDFFYTHFKRQRFVAIGGKLRVKGVRKTVLKPKTPTFKGKLYVLMDGASASATAGLLGYLKSFTGARFIGSESGGNPVEFAANDLLTLVLPNSKIALVIPAIRTMAHSNFQHEGRGLLPDVRMTPSIEAVLAGQDPILEKALLLLLDE